MYHRHTYREDIAGPTWVYRLYDGADLLYVGVASDPTRRFVTHRRTKPWWPAVNRAELSWCPTRSAAFAAERAAIASECPAHNVARPKVAR